MLHDGSNLNSPQVPCAIITIPNVRIIRNTNLNHRQELLKVKAGRTPSVIYSLKSLNEKVEHFICSEVDFVSPPGSAETPVPVEHSRCRRIAACCRCHLCYSTVPGSHSLNVTVTPLPCYSTGRRGTDGRARAGNCCLSTASGCYP